MRDDELMAAYGRGEERALGELVERYLPLVYGAAVRQMRDPGMAGDVAQAVFLVLAKKAGRLKGGALAGWLLKVTHWAARDAMKRRATRVRHEAEAGRMRQEEASEAGEIEAVTRVLDGAMAKLGEGDRTALALRYLQGQSLGEVGAALEVSTETAGKRVQRAVGRLRKVLAREGIVGREEMIERGLGACVVAAVPAALQEMIMSAAANPAGAGLPTALAKEVSHMMFMTKVKVAAVMVMAATAAATPVTVYAVRNWAVMRGEVMGPTVAVAAPGPGAAPAVGGKKITLSNGSTFELVGVCVDPLHTHTWWDAEGHVLTDPPVDSLQAAPHAGNQPVLAGTAEYAFAYRVTFPPESKGGSVSVEPGMTNAFDQSIMEATKDQRHADVQVLGFYLRAGTERAPLKVTTSCGPYEALAHFDAEGKSTDAPAGVSITAPVMVNRAIKATVTFPKRSPDDAYRMMADLKDGSSVDMALYFMNPFAETGQIAMFGHTLEEVKEFRLERCAKATASVDVALAPLPGQPAATNAAGMPAVGTSRMTAIADGTYEEAMLKEGQMIDLDTGTVSAFTAPKRGGFERTAKDLENAGMDLVYTGGPAESSLAAIDMHVLPVQAGDYFSPAPPMRNGRTARFAIGKAGTMTFVNTATKEPATFQFQTREGGVGVVRLEVQEDGGHTVYVRCKLWRTGGAP